MAEPTVTTAWMWQTERGELNGLKIDKERGLLNWYDGVGCACGDSTAAQTVAEYKKDGAAFQGVPEDILQELQASLAALNKA